jgi:hypothetical protein
MTRYEHTSTRATAHAVPGWMASGLVVACLFGAPIAARAESCAARQLPEIATWATEDLGCLRSGTGAVLESCRTEAALRLIEAVVTISERRLARGRSCPPAFVSTDLYFLVDDMARRTLLFVREVMVRFDLTVPAERRLAVRLIETMEPRIDRAVRKARGAIEGRRVDRYARVLGRLHRQLAGDIWAIEEQALAQGIGPRFNPVTMADVGISLAVDLVDAVAQAAHAH